MNTRFDEELFLTSKTGSRLYHEYAENLPIIDYHCHLMTSEICEDKEFEDLGGNVAAGGTITNGAPCVPLGLMRNTSPERQITMTNTLPLPPYSQ